MPTEVSYEPGAVPVMSVAQTITGETGQDRTHKTGVGRSWTEDTVHTGWQRGEEPKQNGRRERVRNVTESLGLQVSRPKVPLVNLSRIKAVSVYFDTLGRSVSEVTLCFFFLHRPRVWMEDPSLQTGLPLPTVLNFIQFLIHALSKCADSMFQYQVGLSFTLLDYTYCQAPSLTTGLISA